MVLTFGHHFFQFEDKFPESLVFMKMAFYFMVLGLYFNFFYYNESFFLLLSFCGHLCYLSVLQLLG